MSEETEAERESRLRYTAMVAGIAIMHDIRMVVREELERVGLTDLTKPLTPDEMASWRKHLRECREGEGSP